MAHVFDGDFSRLEGDRRKKILPAKEILDAIGIRKGNVVIDFGAGIGYFAIPLLDLVGETGRVISVDASRDMVNELKKRAGDRPNLMIMKGDRLPDQKADLILLVNVLHELDRQKDFLEDCFGNLRSGGRVVVIDWQRKETDMGPPVDHRLSLEGVIKLAGRKPKVHPIHEYFYFLEFGT